MLKRLAAQGLSPGHNYACMYIGPGMLMGNLIQRQTFSMSVACFMSCVHDWLADHVHENITLRLIMSHTYMSSPLHKIVACSMYVYVLYIHELHRNHHWILGVERLSLIKIH